MKKQNVLGLVLATSLALTALAGCKVPGVAGLPGNNPPTATDTGNGMIGDNQTGTQQTAAKPTTAESRNGAAEALAEEREMGDYDAVAADEDTAAMYAVSMVGQPRARDGEVAITSEGGAEAETETEAEGRTRGGDLRAKIRDRIKDRVKAHIKAEVKAKLQERRHHRVEKAMDRLKGHADKVRNAAHGAKWVDNGDGTETKSFNLDVTKTVNGKTISRKVQIERTRNSETKDLLASYVKFEETLPNGMTRMSERSKTLNGEDGSYAVTFHSELQFAKGMTRMADWSKTIAADGSVTGSGTITWTNAEGTVTKEVKITLNGTEEATEAEAGGETVDADAPEADDAGTEPVTETSDDATAPDDTTASDDTAVSGDADASAGADTDASAGADADASADATASS